MINLYEEMNEKIADLLLGCDDNGMCMYAGTYIKSLKEKLGEYQKIGTIDECREAREKQQEKAPEKVSDSSIRYTDDYVCPNCRKYFTGTGIAKYCYHCGQAIQWDEILW